MIYILYGEDEFLLNEYVKKIKKAFGDLQLGVNYIQIDESNVSNIISDIETPAFGFEKKLIIAKDTGLFKKKNTTSERITEYLKETEIPDVELIFIEKDIEKNSLFNLVQKIGKVEEFKEQRLPQLISKVVSLAKAYDIIIKENVAQYFIECVGTNMSDIVNELRKLIEYAGKGNEITRDAIDNLSIKKSESIIFELADSLGKKNIAEALNVLNNLIYAKEPVQKILVMLYNHFKKLYIIKLAKEQGRSSLEILKLKPNQVFLVKKYEEQAGRFSKVDLEMILKEIIKLDNLSKSGLVDINIGLESILCMYCS